MPKSFKCPTCAAPLDFEGNMLQNCQYCGGKIIVPADMFRDEEFEHKQKMKKLDSVLKTVMSNVQADQHYVIDLRSSSKKAQQNLNEVFSEVNSGKHSNAVNVFTQTFGFAENDAEKVVRRMERGEGVDVAKMRLYPNTPQKSPNALIIKIGIGFILLLVVLPAIITLIVMIIMVVLSN